MPRRPSPSQLGSGSLYFRVIQSLGHRAVLTHFACPTGQHEPLRDAAARHHYPLQAIAIPSSHLTWLTNPDPFIAPCNHQPHTRTNMSPESALPLSPLSDSSPPPPSPPAVNYVLSFILVGLAWGLTTPFIRRAAREHRPPPHAVLERGSVKRSWVKRKTLSAFFAVLDLLRNPRYAVPLLLNLTGSVWFFLLIGKAGEFAIPNHPRRTSP